MERVYFRSFNAKTKAVGPGKFWPAMLPVLQAKTKKKIRAKASSH